MLGRARKRSFLFWKLEEGEAMKARTGWVLIVFGAGIRSLLVGCKGDPIPNLAKSDCPAANIGLTITSATRTVKPGSQSLDTVKVHATCSQPPPGGSLAGASIQVTFPNGSTAAGRTDASGDASIGMAFPTEGAPGTVGASANNSDDKSQTVTAPIN